jgi:glycosyltransferase involved in cell wall biosynthesis
VSDCYDEDTAKICSMLEGKEDVLIMKKNTKGPSESRNIGIEHARGDVIMFLDDDDRYEIDPISFYQKALTLMDKDTNPIFGYVMERIWCLLFS